ncbi:uncharacterized protein LOC120254820 [Dioscorea cayenensis subsp. rotundata]|uniref:AT-hook motif nuclear-localized protein n=1 Tax=Dioscorea cayennensis subsp. rotundata TaxID=55577 RepID=A0AB40AUX0_DIOCR|nr:uncharacterized protein LOC120254820 [Dioscorea cayenensis subsp. rotundata]
MIFGELFSFPPDTNLKAEKLELGCPPIAEKGFRSPSSDDRSSVPISLIGLQSSWILLIEHSWSENPAARPTIREIIDRLTYVQKRIAHKKPWTDVTMKIISFSQQGPRGICILSANGVISNVTLRQPDFTGGTLTYETLGQVQDNNKELQQSLLEMKEERDQYCAEMMRQMKNMMMSFERRILQ